MRTKQNLPVSYIWVTDNQFAIPGQDVQERKADFDTVGEGLKDNLVTHSTWHGSQYHEACKYKLRKLNPVIYPLDKHNTGKGGHPPIKNH